MSYVQDISKTSNGWKYDLDPYPAGGYSVYLDGVRIALGVEADEYIHVTSAATPPPLEFAAPTDLTISMYGGNQVELKWLHVAGATHYKIEIAVDDAEYSQCCIQQYSGGIECEYRATDISQDCILHYRITPGILVSGLFTPNALPIVNSSYRLYLPTPPVSVIAGYTGGSVYLDALEPIE